MVERVPQLAAARQAQRVLERPVLTAVGADEITQRQPSFRGGATHTAGSSTLRPATRILRWTAARAQSHRRQPMAHDDGLTTPRTRYTRARGRTKRRTPSRITAPS